MDGGLESRCVGRVYGADGAVRLARRHPHHKRDLRSGSPEHHPPKTSENHTLQLSI